MSTNRLSKRPRTNTTLLRGNTNPEWRSFLDEPVASTPARATRSAASSNVKTSGMRSRPVQTPITSAAGADTDETPAVLELRQKIDDLETQLLARDADCRSLRSAALAKDAELIRRSADHSALRLQLEKEKTARERDRDERTREIDGESERVAELERKLAFASNGEQRLQRELLQMEEIHRKAKDKANQRIKALEDEKHTLKVDIAEAREKQTSESLRLMNSDSMLRAGASVKEVELEAALAEVATHRRKAREAALVLEQLNEANAQNARLERETMALRRQLESQIPSPVSTPGAAEATRRIRALERENQTLKSAVQNGHQLMSDLETTKKQLERSDARLQSSIQNEAELGELRELRSAWETVRAAAGADRELLGSPEQLVQVVSDMQMKLTLAVAQTSSLESDLKVEMGAKQHAEGTLNETKRKLAEAESRAERLQNKLAVIEYKVAKVRDEREGYRELVKSFEEAPRPLPGAETDYGEQYLKQIKLLEDTLASVREDNAALEQKLQAAGPSVAAPGTAAAAAVAADFPTTRGSAPDHDPRKTKILHLIDNPVRAVMAARAAELEALRGECASMRLALQASGSAGAPSATASSSSSPAIAPVPVQVARELEELRKELETANKKNQRRMESYAKVVADFRQAVYELFGYEINVYNGSQYRLNSMYAETPDDSLLFQTTESGMQVLQTDFFSEMEQHAKTFIGRCNSIPAFLSTVQLDLFNRQTMMQ